ncbi:MAG: rluB [Bacteroidetes bacterium]|nr:MAG: rluB [Bacteroidota bacterium]
MNAMRKFTGEGSPEKRRKPDGAPDKRRAGKGRPDGKPSERAPRSYKPKESEAGTPSGADRPFKGRKPYGKAESSDTPRPSYRGKRDEKPSAPWKRDETSGAPRERRFTENKQEGDRPYKSRRPVEGREEGTYKPRPYKGNLEDKPSGPWKRDENSGAPREKRYAGSKPSDDRPYKSRRPSGESPEGKDSAGTYRSNRDDKPARPWKRDDESGAPRERRYSDKPSGDRPYKSRRATDDSPGSTDSPRTYKGSRDEKPERPWKRSEESGAPRERRFSDNKPAGDRAYKGRKPADEKERETGSSGSYRGGREDKPARTHASKFSERTPSEPRTRIKTDEGDIRPKSRFADKDEPRRSGTFSRDKSPEPKKQGGKKGYANDGTIRLNKYISNSGICSRREADTLIESGAVSVNGKIVTELGTKVTREDKVQFGGETLNIEKKVYLLLNKPKGYITTVDDPQERNTVMMLIKDACRERVYPVGRLDRNTSGLLLFTNDGEMAKKLTHPGHKVRKVYHVELDKALSKADMIQLSEGVELEDGLMAVDEIAYTGTANDKKSIGVVIHSGKNRVVRRLFEALEYEIVKLDRVAFANLTKKDLPRGRWRFLDQNEINMMMMI